MEDLVPFQVQLERKQHRLLKELASQRARSMGSIVRESVAAYLADLPAGDDPAYALIGLLAADHQPRPYGDVGTEHDRYLADAYAAEAGPDAPRRRRQRP